MNKTICILFLFFLLSNCTKDVELQEQADDFFHLEEKGAYLPLWVRGNTASGKILLYIQGGPGLNTIDFAAVDYAGWKKNLEKNYALAYWDQRGTGNSQGVYELESVNLKQYLIDLRKIVLFLKNQYPENEIYLFGHSFGGWLSYLYLRDYADAPIVAGAIAANAPFTTDHNEERWLFRHDFLLNTAQSKIAAGEDVDYWKEALEWAETHPVLEAREDQRQWSRFVYNGLTDYEVEPPLGLGVILKAVFFSSINIFPTLLNVEKLDAVADRLFKDQAGIKLLEEVDQIKAPLLLITGRFDDIAPPEELEYAFEGLGSANKQLVILPEAGHDSFLNQPEMFQEALDYFLNR